MRFIRFVPTSFFAACEHTWPGSWIRHGQWTFAITETFHIMALGMLLGTIVVLDLRLLGLGPWKQSSSEFASDLLGWTWAAFALMVLTGVPLFMSEAQRLGKSGPFFYKMMFLVVALVVQAMIFGINSGRGAALSGRTGKVLGALSLLSWLGVALAGRAIAFPFLLAQH